MSLITKMLRQTAVYWELASAESDDVDHDAYGQPRHAEPVEIECRWEDVSEEFIDINGTNHMSRARVYVDRDVALGGFLMLGELVDIIDGIDLSENPNAWEIRKFEKLPNLKNTEYLRTVYI